MADDPSLGELARLIGRLQESVDRIPETMNRDFARKREVELEFESVRSEVHVVDNRVGAIETWRTWITRVSVTNLALPLIVGVLVIVASVAIKALG